MQEIGHISVRLAGPSPEELQAVELSLRTVRDVLLSSGASLQALSESFPDLIHCRLLESDIELSLNVGDLISVEVIDEAALGADEIRLRLKPNDRYLELVAAVSRDFHRSSDSSLSHGWPILSVGDRTSTVAEGAAAASSGPGGAPR